MSFKLASNHSSAVVLGLLFLAAGTVVADTRPPAGQMCPSGAFVIGFDASGNIVCSKETGPVSSKAPAPASELTEEDSGGPVSSKPSAPTSDLTKEDSGGPVISKIKPTGVVFGARETTIRIIGSGFTADTVVKFQGVDYLPSVNLAGTELNVTLVTRELPMGRYAITIANRDGKETTRRGALEVF